MNAKDHATVENGVIKILSREEHTFGDYKYAPSDLDKLPRAQKRAIGVYEVERPITNLATTTSTFSETTAPALAADGNSVIITTTIRDKSIADRRADMEVPLWKLKVAIAETTGLSQKVSSYLTGKPPRITLAWEYGDKANRNMKMIRDAIAGMMLTEAEADTLFENAAKIVAD